MSVYLDTSVLVSLFVLDSNTPAAWAFAGTAPDCVVSAWAVAEYSSALSRQVRIGRLQTGERQVAEAKLDQWLERRELLVPIMSDHLAARSMLRSATGPLRTPDTLHLAVCRRIASELATFDGPMSNAASELAIPLVDI